MTRFKAHLDAECLPRHVAIIMDGNGRWAKQRGKRRTVGHEKGADAVKEAVDAAIEVGIEHLTFYAFSTENWKRPKIEVQTLMKLLVSALKKEIESLEKREIKLSAIGNIDKLPAKVHRELTHVINKTQNNSKLKVTLALSYGSREEITEAVKSIAIKVKNNIISTESIDEFVINEHLYAPDLPDVDLLIRTSGEQRISNFLLWQLAYAELYFTKTLWPDFNKDHFYEALRDYQFRERRFGRISEQIKINSKTFE